MKIAKAKIAKSENFASCKYRIGSTLKMRKGRNNYKRSKKITKTTSGQNAPASKAYIHILIHSYFSCSSSLRAVSQSHAHVPACTRQ